MSEKNTSTNKFEKTYIASITNVRLRGPNLAKDEPEIVELPSPVKEMIDEIMKTKYNSDMEKLTQEIKESKIQHELVEELRKEIRNIHEKLGNVEQENKTRIEKEKYHEMEQIKNLQNTTYQKPDVSDNSKKMEPKNEHISLVLSIVLGLVGLSGISHIYLGKIPKGIGILVVSFILIGVAGYFVYIIASQNMLNLLSILHSFWIVPLVGYYGFFAWQIFDARRLCLKYNKYVSESGKLPPWW